MLVTPALVPFAPHHLMHDPRDDKPPHDFYFQPARTLQIIQLVEGHPPPPRRITSILPSSSSSSASSSSSSFSDSDDEAESCSSYCSSDVPPPPPSHHHHPHPGDRPHLFSIPDDETYSYRMKRVCAWRDSGSSSEESSSSSSSSLPWGIPRWPAPRRKPASDTMEDDSLSHTSRCSRYHHHAASKRSTNSLPPYSCPACDTSFPTRQSLRQHGLGGEANEACHAAVEYAFES